MQAKLSEIVLSFGTTVLASEPLVLLVLGLLLLSLSSSISARRNQVSGEPVAKVAPQALSPSGAPVAAHQTH